MSRIWIVSFFLVPYVHRLSHVQRGALALANRCFCFYSNQPSGGRVLIVEGEPIQPMKEGSVVTEIWGSSRGRL